MSQEQVGRYIIIQPLGQGGMATVYRAMDPRFQREVAVKVLPRDLVSKATFRARFNREARIIAALEHPAIVPVYDFGEHDGIPYLVMRLMTGGSLADRLADGPLTLRQAVTIIQQLAGALDEAHAQGIVHRDLKPGNILFDSRNNPHLADFGIVKIAEENTAALTRTGGIIGTPAYMSPEQVKGQTELDGRSDIYSLGIIFFETLTGDPPYKADTPMSLALQHVTEPIPKIQRFRKELPPACEPIIATVLAKEPENRYQTAADFARSVGALLNAVGAAPVPTDTAPPTLYETDAERVLYEAALQAQERRDWETMIARLTALLGLNPDFRDTPALLGFAYRQQQITSQLEAVERAITEEDWSQAADLAAQVLEADSQNARAEELLRQAQRQIRLADTYQLAQQAIHKQEWEPALERLENLLDTAPDYLDVAQLYKEAEAAYQHEQEKAQLLAQGEKAIADGFLEAAEAFLAELQELDSAFPGLMQFQQKLEVAQTLLAARRAMDGYRWKEAVQLLTPIVQAHPDDPDVDNLLATAEENLATTNQAESYYAAGCTALADAAWADAVDYFQKTSALIPEYKDTAIRLQKAKSALADQKQQAAGLKAKALQSNELEQPAPASELPAERHPPMNPGALTELEPLIHTDSTGEASRHAGVFAPTEVIDPAEFAPKQDGTSGRQRPRSIYLVGILAVLVVGSLIFQAVRSATQSATAPPPTPTAEIAQMMATTAVLLSESPETSPPATADSTITASATPSPTDTPAPTSTPRPTNTPRPTTAPTATIDANPAVYDNFDNPALDGLYHARLWQYWDDFYPRFIEQKDGLLVFIGESESAFIAREYDSQRISEAIYYEVDLKLTAGTGSIAMKLHGDLPNNNFVTTQCGIYGPISAGTAFGFCDFGYKDEEGLFQGEQVPLDSWHTFRIEFLPETQTIYHYLDGEKINTITLPEMQTARFSLVVGSYQETEAYIDEVRFGPLE